MAVFSSKDAILSDLSENEEGEHWGTGAYSVSVTRGPAPKATIALPSRTEGSSAVAMAGALTGASETAAVVSVTADTSAEQETNGLDRLDADPWSAQGASIDGSPVSSGDHDDGPHDGPECQIPTAMFDAPDSGTFVAPTSAATQEPVYNGSGDATAAVAASGNQQIDGSLSGVRWSDGSITYSDPNSTADYQAGYPAAPLTGFSQMSAQQMVAVHFALQADIFTQPIGAAGFGVEGFTNLTISYAGSGSGTGTIRVANSSDPGTAYAYYPSAAVTGGDAFFGPSGDFPDAGDYDWHTVLHELGHSLGLKHGHETDVYGALPSNVDSLEFSIMTYRTFIGDNTSGYNYEAFGAPQTFMMLDIAALQYMYGADYTTNSGNTVYTWSQTDGSTFVNGNVAIDPGGNRIFATIWDGGGIDTYDLSNYTTDLVLDLAPGSWSTFSDAQLAFLGGGPNDGFARGNIANALLFGGNNASLIENATGGSGADLIFGNDVANSLIGNAGDDIMKGFGGNDTLSGGDGSDYLTGDDGNDSLTGGAGNDSLYGGSGIDTLDGGDGNDLLYGGFSTDTVNGGNGDDAIIVFEGEFGDVVNGGSGIDTLDLSAVTSFGSTVNLDSQTWDFNPSFGGPNTITSIETVSGTQLDDVLTGTFGTQTLFGNNGNDRFVILDGRFGDDITGGGGTDTLDLSPTTSGAVVDLLAGTYTIAGFAPVWTITTVENVIGTSAADTITGDGAANVLDGGAGDDVIFGGINADTISGGDGNDTLYGGFSTDTVNGGNGNDTIIVLEGEFGDVVNGGSGTDTLDLSNVTSHGATVNLDSGTWDFVPSFGGPNAITSIETVSGTQLDDVLTGTFGTQTLHGNGGNDRFVILDTRFGDNITGGGGIDTLDLSPTTSAATVDLAAGTYTIAGFAPIWTIAGVENVLGTSAADTITGNGAANVINGGGGADTINGGASNDVIDGGAGNDTIHGNDGADTLTSSGDDTIFGDAGNDLIYAGLTAVSETLDGGTGIDTLDTTSFNFGTYIINLETGATNFAESFTNFENLVSGATDDQVTGTAAANNINTGDGNDTVNSGGGNDTLTGGNGDDTLNGGDNADTLFGNAGNDTLSGNAGNDTLSGNVGDDTLNGGDLDDTLNGNDGNDTLNGGNGNDTLFGNAGNDTLNGNTGNDTLTGGDGDDTLTGGDNADTLNGGNGIDTLNGGNGTDALNGGAGNDLLTGGAGPDSFLFNTALNATTNVDQIFDFNSVDDTIQLSSAIFTAAGPVGTLDPAAFRIGANATDASDRIIYNSVTGGLKYDSDGNGAAAAVKFAQLAPGLVMTNNDFQIV